VYSILIIEDDEVISQVLSRRLRQWGYRTETVEDFEGVTEQFLSMQPDLVLLDISLPFFNGYHWCTEIRKHSKVPILFISSAKDNMSMVMALSMGGDDFIAKPFDLDVAVAKIQALLRRAYSFGPQAGRLEYRGAALSLGEGTLSYQGHVLELTKNEFRILQMLLENQGRTVSRESIMRQLWQDESFIDDNTLTVNVARLRKKLEETGLSGWIVTKKGVGYLAPAEAGSNDMSGEKGVQP